MYNPIDNNFNWSTLYREYDNTCRRFDSDSPYLYDLKERPKNDRDLYYFLVTKVKEEIITEGFIKLGTYEAILYWKLYSQPAALKNVCVRIRNDQMIQTDIEATLKLISGQLALVNVTEDINTIKRLYNLVDKYAHKLFGLKDACALPARTTLLHFFYPGIIPLFDKQVLLAVGVTEQGANRRQDYLYKYIEFAWRESKKTNIPKKWHETPLRLLDMALWVTRGQIDP
jgi:hypothetical protein